MIIKYHKQVFKQPQLQEVPTATNTLIMLLERPILKHPKPFQSIMENVNQPLLNSFFVFGPVHPSIIHQTYNNLIINYSQL